MAKKHPKILELVGKICRFGKISNNTESRGRDDWDTAFTIPVTGLLLTKDELNKFRRDKDTHASWFNIAKGLATPMPWWNGDGFPVSEAYEAQELLIVVSGDREITLVGEEPTDKDDPDDDGRAACKITKIVLTPQTGGVTEMRFHLTLRPGIGKNNLLLQEHQHREVKLTLVETYVKERAEKQQQLGLADKAAAVDTPATH